jgi:ribosome-binding factor A
MNRRAKQVASNIGQAVTSVLARGLSDPRIRGMITVTEVEMTDDLLQARIRVSVMPEEFEALTMHGLRAATGHIRREAMKKIHLRSMPTFEFFVDEGLKNQRKILELLDKAKHEKPGWQMKPDEPETLADSDGSRNDEETAL